MNHLEKKRGKNFGLAFSCEDNYGRESNFETTDGKVQCLETIGQNVFVYPTVRQCNIPALFHFLSCAKMGFKRKLFSSEPLQCTAGCLSKQSVTNGGYLL